MHTTCFGMVVNCFKQALNLLVVVAQEHNIAGVSEVRYLDVRANLNAWVILQCLVRTPVDNAIEEGKGKSTFLSNGEVQTQNALSQPHLS